MVDQLTGAGPLHLASEHGGVDAVETLLSLGCRPSCRDTELATPLHYAAARGHADAITALAGAGADVHARETRGTQPRYTLGVRRG